MNESRGADGNSWTTPTTWKGATRKLPVRRASTRRLQRSPIAGEQGAVAGGLMLRGGGDSAGVGAEAQGGGRPPEPRVNRGASPAGTREQEPAGRRAPRAGTLASNPGDRRSAGPNEQERRPEPE